VIRAYGDVSDPDSAKISARVWVEATVQRTPVKHPTSNDPNDNMKPTFDSAVNPKQVGNFGRQFRIVKLRWLRPDEI
jgi:hypothetical protein